MGLISSPVLGTQIVGGNLLLQDLVKNSYRIPLYQRQYEWGKDEVLALLDDINCAITSNSGYYYIGTIILVSDTQDKPTGKVPCPLGLTPKPDTYYDRYDVLDGQQRLTTLALIFAVIRDMISNLVPDHLNYAGDYNKNEAAFSLLEYLLNRGSAELFWKKYIASIGMTITNSNINPYILSQSNINTSKDITICNISKNLKYIHDYFKNKAQQDVYDYYWHLVNKTYVSCLATNKLDDAFTIFKVINSRGMNLGNGDIIKANNLSALQQNPPLQSIYANKWEDKQLDIELTGDFEDIFPIIRDVMVHKRDKSILEDWDKLIEPKYPYGSIQIDEIFKICDLYHDLFIQNQKGDNKFQNIITCFQKGFKSRDWMAPIIKVFYNFPSIDSTTVGLNDLVLFTENLYKKMLSDWIWETPSTRTTNMLKIIAEIGKTNNLQSNQLPSLSSLNYSKSNAIIRIGGKIYGSYWVRSLLLLYEYLLHGNNKFSSINTITIEHILPQQPDKLSGNPGRKWSDWYPTAQDHEDWVNKIGNLVLLDASSNSRLKNLCFDDKKHKYYGNYKPVFLSHSNVMNLPDFNITTVSNRQNQIVNLLTNFL